MFTYVQPFRPVPPVEFVSSTYGIREFHYWNSTKYSYSCKYL